MASAVLERAHFVSHVCADMASLVDELARGAGAIMLAEEVLAGPALAELTGALAAQPPWSDVPVLVLARQGADSRAIANAMDEFANVTVIERPMRVAALVSAVRTALRARRRQYELRSLLDGLRDADQRKTEFLATLAHELRNPLAPLGTALSLLQRKKPAPRRGRQVLRADEPPGRAHGAAGQRPDGGLAHHARQDRAAHGPGAARRGDRRRGRAEPAAGRAGRACAHGRAGAAIRWWCAAMRCA